MVFSTHLFHRRNVCALFDLAQTPAKRRFSGGDSGTSVVQTKTVATEGQMVFVPSLKSGRGYPAGN